MTWSNESEFLSVQDVAERLQVSPARVRQMVDEGKLPPPHRVGARTMAWPAALLELHALSVEGRITGVAALQAPAQRALTRVADVVTPFDVGWGGGGPVWVHVRVFSDRHRVVVVLGGVPTSGTSLTNTIEHVAAAVSSQYLDGRGKDAIWVQYTPKAMFQPQRYANVVLDQARFDPLQKPSRWTAKRPTRTIQTEPWWQPMTCQEVDDLVGFSLEAYVPGAYDRHVVERWLRTRTTVEVEDPAYRAHERAQMIRTLHEAARQDNRGRLAVEAATVLATELRFTLEHAAEMDHDEREPITPRPGDWPRVWASRKVVPQLTPEERDLVERYAHTNLYPPFQPEPAHPFMDLLVQIRQWQEDVDEYADQPDPALHQALNIAGNVIFDRLRAATLEVPTWLTDLDTPSDTVRFFTELGSTDLRFLDQVAWKQQAATPRRRRRLAAQAWDGTELRYGMVQGLLVAEVQQGHRPVGLIMEWPTRREGRLSDQAVIIADGRVGDLPVWIQEPDGLLAPLPKPGWQEHSGWNFGYGGGGPAALEDAIVDAVQRSDQVEKGQLPTAWITDAVEHCNRDLLQVSLADIRRRTRLSDG